MAARRKILIIGGGLGGLTAAIGLLQRGFEVQVFEQAPELRELGAGLTLGPTAMRTFDSLGLWERMRDLSSRARGVAFVHYQTGELLHGERDFDWDAHPETPEITGHAHRAKVHAVLVEAVRALDPQALHLGKQLVGVTQTQGSVQAAFADGTSAEGDVLVAADGLRSVGFRSAFGVDNPATFTGVVAIRCMMPRTAGIEPFLTGGRAVNAVGVRRSFHRYGIDGGQTINCVGLVQTDEWREEGWANPCSKEEFHAHYADFLRDVTGLIDHAPPEQTFKWALFSREPLATWSRGRVTLLGDAAHPMLPFLGQGATAAIEDGLVLARALEANDRLDDALASYEADRLPRATEQMRMSQRQGDALNSGPERYARTRPDQSALSQYDPRQVRV